MRRIVRGRGTVVGAAAVAAVSATLLAVGLAQQQPEPPSVPRTASAAPTAPGGSGGSGPPGDAGGRRAPAAPASPEGSDAPVRGPVLPPSEPVSLSLPSVGASSSLVRLGLQEDGSMETPADPDKAGWFRPGPTPGEQGPAVIAGHVTWNGERSVFFRLGDLEQGDRIDVRREDGRTARFRVDRVERHPKDDFPTVEVYRNLDHAGLRLITCGGTYDEERHYYSDNVVVFASLVGGRR
ncbi:class F sortase [Streptomyces sp. TR06-5]|uniref:class F sortase n=1 Tax=Streptomyces sp. TR06-5 TaxID=3385976 RepID=UPI00399F864A